MKSSSPILEHQTTAGPTSRPRFIRPRRILYFDHTSSMSGGEIALLNLVKHLNRDLFTPVVVLAAKGPLLGKLKQAGVETRVLPLPARVRLAKKDRLGWSSLTRVLDILVICAYILRLKYVIQQMRVDLIHTNSLKADLIGGIAGRLAGKPVIWHVRDRIADDYLPAQVARLFRWLCRWLPTYVIANSNATLNTLALSASGRAVTVYSGVDPRMEVVHDGLKHNVMEDSTNANDAQSGALIGLIGRISPWKGQHIFLQAAARVRKRFPAARFQIVGAALFDEQEYETCIRQLCRELDLEDCVEFTGFRENVLSLVQNMDVVVHASTTGEPFGQVVLEAMALAKPVVATNGGGVPEIVVHGETGLLVPMKDVDAMAEAIVQLLENRTRAKAMGLNALKRAQAMFTIEKTARAVEEVYQKLVN